MIRALLFVLFFILLFGAIGLAIFFGVKVYRKNVDAVDDIRNIKSKYEHNSWGMSKEEKAQAQAQCELAIKDYKAAHPVRKGGLLAAIITSVAMLGLVITIPGSFHQVEAGTYSVVKEVGKIVDIRTPGTYFDFYVTRKYETYDATVQQVKINTAAYSHDAQTMDLEVYLQYQIQLDKLIVKDDKGNIIQTEGIAGKYVTIESLQARIETQTIEKTKAVMSAEHFYDKDPETGLYPINDFAMTGENIIRHRADVSNKVSEVVRAAIGDDYYVIVQDVVLTNIDFTDEFEKSVENKVIEEQNKIAAETKAAAEAEVAKIKAEAEKTVAEIEAEKKIIEANADAAVVKIAADAAAKATVARIVELARTVGFTVNETETGYEIIFDAIHTEEMFKSIVEDYIKYLEYLEQWNGELPQVVAGDDAVSIIVPNN